MNVNELADEISRVNPNKRMGAGELAEHIAVVLPFDFDVDAIAQEIRRVDGNNNLTPTELAEKIVDFFSN